MIAHPPASLTKDRLGLLSNPASIDANFRHARGIVNALYPEGLTALFSPQHGFFSEKQDNMIESEDITDPLLKIPVFSLYGRTRAPTRQMFDPIDTLLVDLHDVGTRVYTFIYTLSYCMEAAAEFGKKVIVLDRPNPLSGAVVEGNCLKEDCTSFVGRYPIPMRHGLTIGELAVLFNTRFNIGCELEVIPMDGWDRRMYFTDTRLPWVAPSPNLPIPESAMVYPGQVLWEGTNISEGRGTTQPFELFGAPFLNPDRIREEVASGALSGAVLRECVFEPTSNKHKRLPCRGFQIHVTDPTRYQPYRTSLALLRAVLLHHADRFEWKPPPYEYEYEKQPIDLLIGDKDIRRRIEAGEPVAEVEKAWQQELDEYIEISREVHLY